MKFPGLTLSFVALVIGIAMTGREYIRASADVEIARLKSEPSSMRVLVLPSSSESDGEADRPKIWRDKTGAN